MAIIVSKMIMKHKTKLPKASVFYLLFAGLVDLGVAFMPVWALTAEGGGLLEHVAQSLKTVLQETAQQPHELVAIFWLPFGVGVSCLGATLAAFFVSNDKPTSARVILFTPLAITIAALGYFLVMRADIHVLAVSLLPLAGAWWEYHKHGRL